NDQAATRAGEPVAGLFEVPARPGCYLRELHDRLASKEGEDEQPVDADTVAFAEERLALARDYGIVASEVAASLIHAIEDHAALGRDWSCTHLGQWREIAGYTAVRPPAAWEQPPIGGGATLAQRLRDDPGALEMPADMLWYAELGDVLAQFNGHDAASVQFEPSYLDVDEDPDPPEPEPLRPGHDSV